MEQSKFTYNPGRQRESIGIYRLINVFLLSCFFILALFFSPGCSYEFPEPVNDIRPGSLTPGQVVFIGDDYLAGFMDGALYREGQHHGISRILAGTLSQAGMDSLVQADIGSENGYNEYVSDSADVQGRYVSVLTAYDPEPQITALPGEVPGDYTGDRSLLNDLTIPFLKSFQFDMNSVNNNKYLLRVLENTGGTSLVSQAHNRQPETFVVWAGMTDILNYAVSGGMGDTLPPSDPALIGNADLTPLPVFRSALENIISTLLTKPEANGIIFTLPSFDDLPFFYYRSYDFMKLTGAQLGLARTFYTEFNDAVLRNNMTPGNPKRPFIGFNDNGYTPYPQPLVVYDPALPDAYYPDNSPLPKIRNLVEGELLLMDLPVEKMEQGYGWLIPVEEKYYLNQSQIAVLQARTEAFNQAIEEVAAMFPGRVAVVDIRESVHQIAETGKLNGWGSANSDEEYYFDGVPLTGRLGLNSIFSLDGLHFNQRGCAYLSGIAVNQVNLFFDASLPGIDVNNFKGNIPQY